MACRFEKINDRWIETCDGSSKEGWNAARQNADSAEGARMNDEADVAGLSGLPGLVLDRFEDSVGLAPRWKTAKTNLPDIQYAQAGINEEAIRGLVKFIAEAQDALAIIRTQPDMAGDVSEACFELEQIRLGLVKILASARSSEYATTFMRTVYQTDKRFSHYLTAIVNSKVLKDMKDNGPKFRQAVSESVVVFRSFNRSCAAAFRPASAAVVGTSASQASLMHQLVIGLRQMEGEFQSMPPGWKVAMLIGVSITSGVITYVLADED